MAIKFTEISFLEGDFDNEVAEYQKFAERKTGFDAIDDAQIFMPGLYVLGGLPGAGKSTFALQMLYQLAAQGEQCYYFSFEMSAVMLWAKVLARELFNRHFKRAPEKAQKSAMTAANLMRGRGVGNKEVDDLKRELASSNLPLKIAEVNLSAKELIKELEKLPTTEGAVVVLDYLQLLAYDKEQTRGALDEAIFSFREYQRKTKTTLIILSAFNRESYKGQVTMASFKESGAIEYTADVVLALQTFGVGDDGKFDSDLASEESRQPLRRIQLRCLKNRFGGQYSCDLWYYAKFDCFRSNVGDPFEEHEKPSADKTKRKSKFEK